MPLTFNSPRASPFQRPSSPGSPTTPTVNRQSTPTQSSPGRGPNHTPTASPSKLKQSYTAEDAFLDSSSAAPPSPTPTPTVRPFIRSQTEPPRSAAFPSTTTPRSAHQSPSHYVATANLDTTLLSRLPAPLVHTLRETFSVLDTDSSNTLTPSDILSTFSSLSLPAPSPAEMSQFFPSNGPQQISLPVFLNTLAGLLCKLSPERELREAFSAFDEGDCGEIDVDELKQAVLHTVPDVDSHEDARPLTERDFEKCVEGWTGRRAFVGGVAGGRGFKNVGGNGAGKKGGEVFRYHDFVGNIMSGGMGMGGDEGKGAVAV